MGGRFYRSPIVGWTVTMGMTMATYAAALAAWATLARSFPERTERPAQGRGTTHWVANGEVPLTVEGHLEGARTLAVGDSRTWMAVDRAVLDASAFGPSCVLWGSGGDLRVLLDEAAKESPELLIVGLTPHSIGPDINEIFTEVTRERFPVFRAADASTSSVRKWRREESLHLVEAGYPANLVEIFLERLQSQFLRERALLHDPTARLDAWLDGKVQRFRFDHVYTLKPSRWRNSWLCKNDQRKDEKAYRRLLNADHFKNGKETFRQSIIDRLRVVAAKMPTVVVRFPLSAEVRAVEDEAAPQDWMAEVARAAHVPYVDYGTAGVTADGSHVTTNTATWVTTDLIGRLSTMELGVVEDVMQGALPGYCLDDPDLEIDLPDELKEISGIVFLEAGAFLCIQDERGELYTLRTADPGAAQQEKFGPQDDYEALARAGDRLFVLRRDGLMQELNLQGEARGDAIKLGGDLAHDEYESLCYQPSASRLLFAPKDPPAKGGDLSKHDRPIYSVDLDTHAVNPDPMLVFSVKELIERAEAEGWPLPEKTTKKGKRKVDFRCKISDMAVHPLTGEIYVLCGTDRVLIALDAEGKLQGTAVFPQSMLPQPEGLAFEPGGALILTSEGQDGAGRLLRYTCQDGD